MCDGKRCLCLITGFFGFMQKLLDETEHIDHARGCHSLIIKTREYIQVCLC